MDRNQLIGITLMAVMLVVYTQFFAPIPPTTPILTKEQNVSTEGILSLHPAQTPHLAAHATVSSAQGSILLSAAQDTVKEVVLENEVMRVVLTSQGGKVKSVVLKKYQNHENQPLTLLDEHSSAMGFQYTLHGTQFNTNTLFFETTMQEKNVAGTGLATATFTLPIAPGQYIRHVFSLSSEGYTLTHAWAIVGLGASLGKEPVQFVWHNLIKRVEKDVKACRNNTTINYYLADNQFEHLRESSEKAQEQLLQSPIQWLGIKQRFFTTGIIAQEAFAGGHISTIPTPQSIATVKEAKVYLTLPGTDTQQDREGLFTFYFGPNDYQTLKQVTKGFSKNISLGWPVVCWINQFLIIPSFTFLEKYISNYGIIIILLVVFIKSLLLPLSYKSYVSMAKMKVIKPSLDALKAKYGDDIQKMQVEQMNLYRDMGINPLSGCIPVLLQMPILLAMFNFLPNAIALRQQSFLWASDLSTYDTIIHLPFSIPAYGNHVSLFTLLMTASTILYTWSSNQLTPPQGPMKMMSYMVPFTFMFILNSFPAGLSFYYFVSNLVTFGQQSLIKWFVDEEEIKQKMRENKIKNKDKKKSRFQLHLEKMMRVEKKVK